MTLLLFSGCGGGGNSDAGLGSDGLTFLDVGAALADSGADLPAQIPDAATADGIVATNDLSTPDLSGPRPPDAMADVFAADEGSGRSETSAETGATSPDLRRSDLPGTDTGGAPQPDAVVTPPPDAVVAPSPDARDAISDAGADGPIVKLDAAAPDLATPDASTVVPVLSAISPTSANEGQAISLVITGTGFEPGAIAYFDGQALATTVNGPTSIEAQVTSAMTAQAGSHSVSVANASDRTSNVLYLGLLIPAGAPEVLDYNPDNGVAGATITIIGNNLASEAITITGPGNLTATPGTVGSDTWLGNAVDTVTFTIPANWQTGAIVVANSKGSSRGKIFNVGTNLARLSGVTVQASSEYSSAWAKERGADNDLSTSWFSQAGDCATLSSCTSVPWISVTFPSAQNVSRVAVRGNREYASGYDILRARIDLVGSGGVLWTGAYDLPDPDRDLDIKLPAPLAGVTSIKLTSLADESDEPGLSELEVF